VLNVGVENANLGSVSSFVTQKNVLKYRQTTYFSVLVSHTTSKRWLLNILDEVTDFKVFRLI